MGLKEWLSLKGDKRIFLRLLTPSLMNYRKVSVPSDLEGLRLANVKDVSEGGLMFVAYEAIPVSATIKVSFKLPGRDAPIECFAKVSRTTKVSEKDEIYHVGVNFLDINSADRADVAEFVSKMSQSSMRKEIIVKPRWWRFWKKKRAKKIQHLRGVFYSREETEH